MYDSHREYTGPSRPGQTPFSAGLLYAVSNMTPSKGRLKTTISADNIDRQEDTWSPCSVAQDKCDLSLYKIACVPFGFALKGSLKLTS